MTNPARRYLSLLCAILFVTVCPHLIQGAQSASYLTDAEQYTVKIRTRVEYPGFTDNKGSFTGAGFLIDASKGWIATNAHVSSRNPASIEVAFKAQAFTEAKLIYADQHLDLAVIEISPEAIPKRTKRADLNCSAWPEIGSEVGAYGHPLSLDFSITRGVVSGSRYRHNRYWIQTDAAINSGNSGGPLIDIRSGKVVGINAATYSKNTSEGVGFAVPAIYVCRVLELLWDGGNASAPFLPVAFALNEEAPNKLMVAANYEGLPVSWHLNAGDQIISLADEPFRPLRNQADLIHALRGKLGEVAINILREGESVTVNINTLPRPKMADWVGLHFSGVIVGREIMRDDALSNPNGELIILDVASASTGSVSGFDAYDYIATVDGLRFTTVNQLCEHLGAAADEGRKVTVLTRSRSWDYRSATKYAAIEVKVDGVKLVGPKVSTDEGCT
jgi:serine protease Do